MKKTKFLLVFSDSDNSLFETNFELPNSVNPAEFLSQVFPDYFVKFIDYSKYNINLVLYHGE